MLVPSHLALSVDFNALGIYNILFIINVAVPAGSLYAIGSLPFILGDLLDNAS